jgi:hypothetical protein
MYQIESKSASRVELNRKNSNHAEGEAIAKGRFTAIHVPAVVQPSVIARSGSRSLRRCAISGTTSIAG